MESPSSAPAGNATPASSTPNGTSGLQTPVAAPKPKPNGAPIEARAGLQRGPDGKFIGGQNADAEKALNPEKEEPKPYRFKRKLKNGDEETEVDLDEEGIAREVSIAQAAKRRFRDIARREKEMLERETALSAREKDWGQNPEEYASRVLAARAQRGLMTPEQIQLTELQEKLQASEERWAKHEETQKTQAQQAYEDSLWQKEEPQYLAAMQKLKLPQTMSVLSFMAKVGQDFTQAFGEDYRPSPEHVVAEANEQLSKFAEHYILSLPTEALAERLGKERLKALMQHRLDNWRAAQANQEPTPREESPVPAPQPQSGPRQFLTEAEVDARIRASNKH